jgi:hypothetical protein
MKNIVGWCQLVTGKTLSGRAKGVRHIKIERGVKTPHQGGGVNLHNYWSPMDATWLRYVK